MTNIEAFYDNSTPHIKSNEKLNWRDELQNTS